MKIFLIGLACFSVLTLVACTSNEEQGENKTAKGESTSANDSNRKGIIIDPALPPIQPVANDSMFTISFTGSKEQSIRGRLGFKGPDIICKFSITKAQTLTAKIIPEKADCNIRFTQIIMPGNDADGPFGRDIKYQLPSKGNYQLIIGHNMMAGDPEVCDFEMKINIQ